MVSTGKKNAVAGKKKAAPCQAFYVGARVRVKGLLAKDVYNGKVGVISDAFMEASGRWPVNVIGSGCISIKPENMELVREDGQFPVGAIADTLQDKFIAAPQGDSAAGLGMPPPSQREQQPAGYSGPTHTVVGVIVQPGVYPKDKAALQKKLLKFSAKIPTSQSLEEYVNAKYGWGDCRFEANVASKKVKGKKRVFSVHRDATAGRNRCYPTPNCIASYAVAGGKTAALIKGQCLITCSDLNGSPVSFELADLLEALPF
eukprot:TRINITY_DN29171_c0_g1_i1.p1 TRINITY_DN29171_c0_g1~~TRINITY_DN29171_c0_g1_i1.p1  ORF type:complete len:259 (+),score=52.02 TRINITY_DN29171_c0_g1_i1:185-961(+)